MLIFDAHLDLAWNGVEWNRNLELPCTQIREFEKHFQDIVPGDCTVSFPEMHKGRIGLCVATLLPRLHRKQKELTFYQSREAAHGSALGQLGYYRALVAKGVLVEIPSRAKLQQEYDRWQAVIAANPNDTSKNPPIGFILSMEGAPPILSPSQVQQWYDWGLRIVGPGAPSKEGHQGLPLRAGTCVWVKQKKVRCVVLYISSVLIPVCACANSIRCTGGRRDEGGRGRVS